MFHTRRTRALQVVEFVHMFVITGLSIAGFMAIILL